MKNSKRSFNKGLIVLNKGERIAVISLLSIIAIFLGISVFRTEIKLSKKEKMAFHNLDSMIAIQEEAVRMQQEKALISENKTMSEPPAKTTKKTYSSKPKNTTAPSYDKPSKSEAKTIPILDINIADSTALIDLPQIGQVMASRIHRYRNRLGGFVAMNQLFEIKGMDTERFETIKPYIVLEQSDIIKINVNQDEFKTLLRHPYLEYEQVKAIVNHREKKGFIKDWEQLQNIVGEVNPLLESYVCY
jgi:DNA uptake protein ComE-like DNA-binding protein